MSPRGYTLLTIRPQLFIERLEHRYVSLTLYGQKLEVRNEMYKKFDRVIKLMLTVVTVNL